MKKTRKAAPKARKSVVRAITALPPKSAARRAMKTPTALAVAKQQPRTRSTTKAARVLTALQQPQGATVSELMQATGWQAHSVRGFLSGTVRKRLNLPLLIEDTAAGRRYRLAEAAPPA